MKISSIILLGILTLGLLESAVADLNDGLVAYYPFDGNAHDESSNGNDGIIFGAILTTDRFGRSDNAFQFDGTGYIVVNDHMSLDFDGDFSIAFWIQRFNTSEHVEVISKRRICNQDPFFDIRQSSPEKGINLEISNGIDNPGVRSESQNDDSWHHIVFIRKGTLLKAFTDQQLSNTRDLGKHYNIVNNADLKFSNGPCVGVGSENITRHLNGKLDDIRLYKRALSESEIQELYQEGTDACTEYKEPTVTPNLDIHLPSLNYQSLTDNLNLWVDLEFHGKDGNNLLWKLKDFGEHEGSAVACETDTTITVSPNLDIQLLSIDYQLLSGTLNLWANFKYHGQGSEGELLWKLLDYGEN